MGRSLWILLVGKSQVGEMEHKWRGEKLGRQHEHGLLRSPPFLKMTHPPTLLANGSSQVFPINRNATEIKLNKYSPCKTTT